MSLNPQNLRPGFEQYKHFPAPRGNKHGLKRYCQYDYRHIDGELFSCVAPTLEAACAKRDTWLAAKLPTTDEGAHASMTRPAMTDVEYAAERDGCLDICPSCRARTASATGTLDFDSDGELATFPLQCEKCGFRWKEILRPVGYEPILDED